MNVSLMCFVCYFIVSDFDVFCFIVGWLGIAKPFIEKSAKWDVVRPCSPTNPLVHLNKTKKQIVPRQEFKSRLG